MNARRLKLVLAASLAGAGLVAGAFYALRRSELLQPDGERTRSAVLARVPLGTQVARAQAIMEAEGFACRRMPDAKFADDAPDGRGQQVLGPVDLLWCDSGGRITPALFVLKRWQVEFVIDGDRVSRVGVGVGLIGL